MITRKEMRQQARNQLGNNLFHTNWLMMVLICLIYNLLIGLVTVSYSGQGIESLRPIIITFSTIFSIAYLLISGPLEYGISRAAVNTARKNQKPEFNDLWTGFKECMGDAILLGFLTSLFIALWSLLFIIPGIIKAYSYAMAPYIQQDDDNKDWSYCLNKSKEMMKGQKWNLFVLDLSFIGWEILGALCLGIGLLWVEPYRLMSRANFYLALRTATGEDAKEEDNVVVDAEDVIEVDEKIFEEAAPTKDAK